MHDNSVYINEIKELSYNLNKLYDEYPNSESEITKIINNFLSKSLYYDSSRFINDEICNIYSNLLINNMNLIEKYKENEIYKDFNNDQNCMLELKCQEKDEFLNKVNLEQTIENLNEYIINEQKKFKDEKDNELNNIISDQDEESTNTSMIEKAEFHLNKHIKKILIILIIILNVSTLLTIFIYYIKYLL